MKGVGSAAKAAANLRALGPALRRAAAQAASETAQSALREAQSRAPVRTGRLRGSLSVRAQGGSAIVCADCAYAAAVELGTSRRPARPFLHPRRAGPARGVSRPFRAAGGRGGSGLPAPLSADGRPGRGRLSRAPIFSKRRSAHDYAGKPRARAARRRGRYTYIYFQLPVIAWRESGNREFAQAGGGEHLAELEYTVDVWSDSPAKNADSRPKSTPPWPRRGCGGTIRPICLNRPRAITTARRAIAAWPTRRATSINRERGGKHMATSAQGTTLKFTPASGTQDDRGRLTSIGEIAPRFRGTGRDDAGFSRTATASTFRASATRAS